LNIKLAADLVLPADAATQTFLVVGKRGSGKSTTCVRFAEQLIKASVPIVVVDPVDRWWGLKAARDGKGPGLSVYVFGGEHADLPLQAGAGALIADTIVEHRISTVLSVKHLSGRERGHFVAELAGRLFQRNREPLHVFLEEAHEVAPQQPFKGEEEMLGRVTRLWKLGRSSGLGGSAITQRPASLSKNITTQAEILIVHRMLGPQDVAAVREWIRYHGEREDILGQLATLKTGEAFIWAPDFPESKPIGLRRIQILDRETFDSTATPQIGARAVEPRALAPVDLEQLKAKMAATIEKAKAEDPRALRAEVARLKGELAKAPKPVQGTTKTKTVEIAVVKPATVKAIERAIDRCDGAIARATNVALRLREHCEVAEKCAAELRGTQVALVGELKVLRIGPPRTLQVHPPVPAPGRPVAIFVSRRTEPGSSIPTGERRVLIAIAQHPDGVTREQVTILTGFKQSTRNTYIQRAGERGHVATTGDRITVTQAGVNALGADFEPLPTGDALLTYWRDQLPDGERRILDVVVAAYPKTVDREAVSEATDFKQSTRNTYLQRLGTRRLIVAERGGQIRAAEELFG
jgi:hypothetical protein